jgi:hypothetical protein
MHMNLAPVIAAVAGAARPPDSPAPAPAAAGRTLGAGPTVASGPSTAPGTIRGTSLGDVVRGLSTAAGQRNAERLGGLLSTFVRGAVTTGTVGAPTTGAAGSLAFLKDPRLSVEEKLARLMIQLSDKYERQLEEKLRQFADLESGKATPSASTAKKGSWGALGALGDGISALLGKAGAKAGGGTSSLTGALLPKLATQLTGPVLAGAATVLGMPALAPAILKAGPAIGGVLASLTGGAAPKPKATGTPASSTPAPSEKQLMTEIQILQEKQREMFTLVSNILRSQHDTKMAVISNVR